MVGQRAVKIGVAIFLVAHATVAHPPVVSVQEVTTLDVNGTPTSWASIDQPLEPQDVELRWTFRGEAPRPEVHVPTCAGRRTIRVDGVAVHPKDAGPVQIPVSEGQHVLTVGLTVGAYERRIACGAPLRAYSMAMNLTQGPGLQRIAFPSPHPGGGAAAAFIPWVYREAPAALLVMPHPWNGSIWTYAAYAELLDEAEKRGVVLLFPSGLGNSLYTADAEDEVMRAIDALEALPRTKIDPQRISIAGASMGGAGATTIGFHHPDRFASITSFFGDAKYDLKTYVRAILHDEAGAHLVNAVDVADNARWVPVWLIHGEEDRVSPIAQSEILERALKSRGFQVRFDRVPGFGHSGQLVAKFARELVRIASEAHAPEHPPRVTYRSVRASDRGAYGVTLARAGAGDAYMDVERAEDGSVHVHQADNVRTITLASGALGARDDAGVIVEPRAGAVVVKRAGAGPPP